MKENKKQNKKTVVVNKIINNNNNKPQTIRYDSRLIASQENLAQAVCSLVHFKWNEPQSISNAYAINSTATAQHLFSCHMPLDNIQCDNVATHQKLDAIQLTKLTTLYNNIK